MPVGGVNMNYGNYCNNPYYDYARNGRYQTQGNYYGNNPRYDEAYAYQAPSEEKKSGSVFGKILLGTMFLAASAIGLSVAHKRLDFLPKGGKIEQAATWITEHCQKWAEMGKNKLVEKFPDGDANPSKIAEWGKKALDGIIEFFQKGGK